MSIKTIHSLIIQKAQIRETTNNSDQTKPLARLQNFIKIIPVLCDPEENSKRARFHEAQSPTDRRRPSTALCKAPSHHPLHRKTSNLTTQTKALINQ